MISFVPTISLLAALSAPQSTDSIYALAVDSAKYPQEAVVWLLDYGDFKREQDGRGSMTFRSVVQVLRQSAVARYQEMSFGYGPGHERVTINWMRVLNTKGEVISEAPTHVQDADIPAQRGDPIYSDRKVKRVSLTGVAPGTIVDYSYTREELKPFLESDFFMAWRVTPAAPVMRSYFRADVPASMKLHLRERNLNFKRAEKIENGRRVITWATSNVPPLKPELFTPDSMSTGMHLEISGPIEWKDIARWYADNAKDRYVPSETLKSKVADLVKNATSLDDSIGRVHKWVAQDIRYVAIALGMGGYQPRMPDSVLKTGFGDCKDKATLFIAALKLLGVPAYPVILNSFGRVSETVPSISQFDHVVVALDRGSRRQYVDMTADTYRIGLIPLRYQGSFGVLVHPDGTSESIRFPTFNPAEHQLGTTITGTLSEDGQFKGWHVLTGIGEGEIFLRNSARTLTDSARKDIYRTATTRRVVRDGEADSLETFQALDLSAKPMIRVRIAKGRMADPNGAMMILSSPFEGGGPFSAIAARLEKEPKRVSAIDLRVLSSLGSVQELAVELPGGWRAKLPANVRSGGPLGTYTANYTQEGNILRIVRTMKGVAGILLPERMPEVIAWLRQAGKDEARFIVLERGT